MIQENMIEALAKAISQSVGEYVMPGGDLRLAAAAVLEIMRPKRLVWDYIANTHTWQSQSPYGEYSVGFDDGWWGQLIGNMPWEWEPDCDPRTYDGPDAAQAAAQDHADAQWLASLPLGELLRGD